jgi:hypothetical protein
MEDRIFIENYLNDNFKLGINGSGIFVYDRYDKQRLNEIQFRGLAAKILGTYLTDEGISSRKVIDNWIDSYAAGYFDNLKKGLHYYKVVLKERGWVCVDQDYNPIELKELNEKFKDEYSPDVIQYYYEMWFIEKITLACEKLMGIY